MLNIRTEKVISHVALMGCTKSAVLYDQSRSVTSLPHKPFSDHTRIVQEEEVDEYINDERDVTTSDWEGSPGNFRHQNVLYLETIGRWTAGESAGGSRNDLELFSTNPQYLIALGPPERHPNDDEFYLGATKSCDIDVQITLTQTDFSNPPLHIAFFVYKTDNMDERLSAEYFLCMPPEGHTGTFVNWRQIKRWFKLPAGLYIIIPASFSSGKEGTFKLSIKTIPPAFMKRMPSPNHP